MVRGVSKVIIMIWIGIVLLLIGVGIFIYRGAPVLTTITLSGCWSKTVGDVADIEYMLEGPKIPFTKKGTWGNKTIELDEACVDKVVFTNDIKDYRAFWTICTQGESYILAFPQYGEKGKEYRWWDIVGFEKKLDELKDRIKIMNPVCRTLSKPLDIIGPEELEGGKAYTLTVINRSAEAEKFVLKIEPRSRT